MMSIDHVYFMWCICLSKRIIRFIAKISNHVPILHILVMYLYVYIYSITGFKAKLFSNPVPMSHKFYSVTVVYHFNYLSSTKIYKSSSYISYISSVTFVYLSDVMFGTIFQIKPINHISSNWHFCIS